MCVFHFLICFSPLFQLTFIEKLLAGLQYLIKNRADAVIVLVSGDVFLDITCKARKFVDDGPEIRIRRWFSLADFELDIPVLLECFRQTVLPFAKVVNRLVGRLVERVFLRVPMDFPYRLLRVVEEGNELFNL